MNSTIDTAPFASVIQDVQLQLRNCQKQLRGIRESINLLIDEPARNKKIEALKLERQSIRSNTMLSDRKRKRLLSENQSSLRQLRRLNEPSVVHYLYRSEYELETRMAQLTGELAQIHQMNRRLQSFNH